MEGRLDELISSSTPCFFYTDFKGDRIHAFALGELEENDIEFAFNSPLHPNNKPHKPFNQPIEFSLYNEKFDLIQEEIRNGNTYLINLTQPTPIETALSLKEIYTMANAPYKMRIKDEFVCFSPEPFIRIENGIIHTYPMKGTIDASIPNAVEKILNDPKETAEHTMIVDLLRNDIGMIAQNVTVDRFRYITSINTGNKTLYHVSSHITGRLNQNWQTKITTLIKPILPAGSISGTPKRKTVEILERVEGYQRGYFTGIFGYFDGKILSTAVAIRFIEKQKERFVYKSGGGITSDSNAVSEYQEMIDKIYIP
ncbi:MAG: aminodeoxychorismate synthase component I [Sulfuricurvum sp.]